MFIDIRPPIGRGYNDRRLIAGFAALAFATLGWSGVGKADEAPKPKTTPNTSQVEWGGLGWGLGIATNFDIAGRRVGSVDVDANNIVRVKDTSSNVNISFVLEAHYFLRDLRFSFGNPSNCKSLKTYDPYNYINCTDFAWGPFVAIEVGGGTTAPKTDGVITALAMGWMVGMRHPASNPDNKNSSWNLGVGLRVTPNSQVLGDGIIANQRLPAGETAPVRLKTEPSYGVTLLSSFSF
jgi:hypothetical protein